MIIELRSGMLTNVLRYLGIYKLYEKWLLKQVKTRDMPQHLAVILDGNRRWAFDKALPTSIGHREGAKKGESFLEWCLDLRIETITFYVFSAENFKRPKREKNALFKIIEEYIEKLKNDPRIHRNQVKVKAIGKIDSLPINLKKKLLDLEKVTQDYKRFFFNIAIAYGGRTEILDAVKKLIKEVIQGKITVGAINEKIFKNFLYTSHLSNPYPDLVLRSSGEERLSGFLLWQTAYSELFFLDVYWPDFRKIDLLRALRAWKHRKRRFGS